MHPFSNINIITALKIIELGLFIFIGNIQLTCIHLFIMAQAMRMSWQLRRFVLREYSSPQPEYIFFCIKVTYILCRVSVALYPPIGHYIRVVYRICDKSLIPRSRRFCPCYPFSGISALFFHGRLYGIVTRFIGKTIQPCLYQ